MITGQTRECLDICDGLTSDADVAARAALWRLLPLTYAAPGPR